MTVQTVRFSKANRKLIKLAKDRRSARWLRNGRKIYSFSVPAGITCPGASICLGKVVVVDGKRKFVRGPNTEKDCWAAREELAFTNLFVRNHANYDALRGKKFDEILPILRRSLPHDAGIVRVHVSGDFFSRDYLAAWIALSRENPDRLFYAYTKSLKFLTEFADTLPENFRVTLSAGGRYDNLIPGLPQFPVAVIVNHPSEAKELGLRIDSDDSSACHGSKSFALLLHGVQTAGTAAAAALIRLRKEGISNKY